MATEAWLAAGAARWTMQWHAWHGLPPSSIKDPIPKVSLGLLLCTLHPGAICGALCTDRSNLLVCAGRRWLEHHCSDNVDLDGELGRVRI